MMGAPWWVVEGYGVGGAVRSVAHGEAAVDGQDDAVDVGGRLGGEEGHGRGYLVGVPMRPAGSARRGRLVRRRVSLRTSKRGRRAFP